MNSLTSCCICSILRRMLRMISTPARLTPRSRVSDRIVSSCSRSSSEYSRVFPSVRDGFSSPSRSYRRKRLRVDVVLLRHRADHVIRLAGFLHGHDFTTKDTGLKAIRVLVSLVSFVVHDILPHIFAVDPPELPQQLLRSLVEHLRQHEPHFDDEIAAAAVARLTGRRARAAGTAGPTACRAARAAAPGRRATAPRSSRRAPPRAPQSAS